MTKNLHYLTLIATIFIASCSNKKTDTPREMVLLNDSAYNSSMMTDTSAGLATIPEAPPVETSVKVQAPRTRTQTKIVYVTVPTPAPQPAVQTPPPPAPVQTVPSNETANTAGTQTSGTENSGAATPAKPEVKEKKGMSKSAQGAIIGGVGGAVAGAVISKKKGTGAIIGGVIGAAGGYILGKKKDKADNKMEYYSKNF